MTETPWSATPLRVPSAGWALGAALAAYAVLYRDSYHVMAELWWRSQTYAHGMWVFPLALYLVWRHRQRLHGLAVTPDGRAVPVLLVLAAAWTLMRLAEVAVGEHLATVLIIPALVWAILGWPWLRALAFPLVFLLFAVPFGDEITPRLMAWTADLTVLLLTWSGIPVFQDGLYFSIPGGDFEVAEACSGIRYLIASIMLGTLYAHLTFHAWWRRAVFMVFSALIPLIANGIRAYIIVLIAHWSDMRLAHGIDHFIYGWLFFGIVMFVLFAVGHWFRDAAPVATQAPYVSPLPSRPRAAIAMACLATLILALGGPLGLDWVRTRPAVVAATTPSLPQVPGWSGPEPVKTAWQPDYAGADSTLLRIYRQHDRRVYVYLAHYAALAPGKDLASAQHRIYDPKRERLYAERLYRTQGTHRQTVVESDVHARVAQTLVWQWYRVDGHNLARPIEVKLLHLWAALRGRSAGGYAVVVAHEYTDRPEDARRLLATFLDQAARPLAACLDALPGTACP